MKQVLILLICVLYTLHAEAQNKLTYGIAYGPNYQVVKESRFTSNFRSGLGMVTSLQIGLSNETAWKNLKVSFIYNKTGKDLTSPMISLTPDLRFEYIRKRKIKSFQFGAYADIGSSLGFRVGRWDDVNGISYAIWSGIGVMAQYEKEVEALSENTKFRFSIAQPLVSYVIRPASVRFPYPDKFLEQENFNFDLDGLAGSIISSGKLKTINSFVNLKIETGIDFQIKEGPWHLGIFYGLHYLYVKEHYSLIQFNNQISFVIRKF